MPIDPEDEGWTDDTPDEWWHGKTDSGFVSWICLSAEIDAPKATTPHTFDFVASTGAVDRMGDSIEQGTWLLAEYRKNPVILYEHKHPVVGKSKVRIATVGASKRLEQRITFDASEVNPLGMLAAHQHANGFRKAVSVGFIPGKGSKYRAELDPADPLYVDPKSIPWKGAGGMFFRHNTLHETSTVAVPANPEALQLSLDLANAEDHDSALTRFLGETLDRKTKAILLDAIRTDPDIRRAIQAQTLGEVPGTGPRWVQE